MITERQTGSTSVITERVETLCCDYRETNWRQGVMTERLETLCDNRETDW